MTSTAIEAPTIERRDKRVEIPVRPGVTFPDWSVIHSETARAALCAIVEAFGNEKLWAGHGESEDRLLRAVLEQYACEGQAPSMAQLSTSTSLSPREVRVLLAKLKARDLIVLDDGDETITGAYPFTERSSGYRVHMGGRILNAMCAIDALGAGAMYGKDSTIDASCRACGAKIYVETRERGTALGLRAPASAIVWSGMRYEDDCAATSLCTVLTFFCSDEHLSSWRRTNEPDLVGFRLSMDEALQVGMAIFTPFLATLPSDD